MEARSFAASISLNSAALARAGLEMAEAVPMMMMGSSAGKAVELFDIASFFASSLARLAQSAERKALNLVVVGSSPTVGVSCRVRMCLCGNSRPWDDARSWPASHPCDWSCRRVLRAASPTGSLFRQWLASSRSPDRACRHGAERAMSTRYLADGSARFGNRR